MEIAAKRTRLEGSGTSDAAEASGGIETVDRASWLAPEVWGKIFETHPAEFIATTAAAPSVCEADAPPMGRAPPGAIFTAWGNLHPRDRASLQVDALRQRLAVCLRRSRLPAVAAQDRFPERPRRFPLDATVDAGLDRMAVAWCRLGWARKAGMPCDLVFDLHLKARECLLPVFRRCRPLDRGPMFWALQDLPHFERLQVATDMLRNTLVDPEAHGFTAGILQIYVETQAAATMKEIIDAGSVVAHIVTQFSTLEDRLACVAALNAMPPGRHPWTQPYLFLSATRALPVAFLNDAALVPHCEGDAATEEQVREELARMLAEAMLTLPGDLLSAPELSQRTVLGVNLGSLTYVTHARSIRAEALVGARLRMVWPERLRALIPEGPVMEGPQTIVDLMEVPDPTIAIHARLVGENAEDAWQRMFVATAVQLRDMLSLAEAPSASSIGLLRKLLPNLAAMAQSRGQDADRLRWIQAELAVRLSEEAVPSEDFWRMLQACGIGEATCSRLKEIRHALGGIPTAYRYVPALLGLESPPGPDMNPRLLLQTGRAWIASAVAGRYGRIANRKRLPGEHLWEELAGLLNEIVFEGEASRPERVLRTVSSWARPDVEVAHWRVAARLTLDILQAQRIAWGVRGLRLDPALERNQVLADTLHALLLLHTEDVHSVDVESRVATLAGFRVAVAKRIGSVPDRSWAAKALPSIGRAQITAVVARVPGFQIPAELAGFTEADASYIVSVMRLLSATPHTPAAPVWRVLAALDQGADADPFARLQTVIDSAYARPPWVNGVFGDGLRSNGRVIIDLGVEMDPDARRRLGIRCAHLAAEIEVCAGGRPTEALWLAAKAVSDSITGQADPAAVARFVLGLGAAVPIVSAVLAVQLDWAWAEVPDDETQIRVARWWSVLQWSLLRAYETNPIQRLLVLCLAERCFFENDAGVQRRPSFEDTIRDGLEQPGAVFEERGFDPGILARVSQVVQCLADPAKHGHETVARARALKARVLAATQAARNRS